ncbi:MAG: hypothetical protein HFF67_06220 [Oscillospiraceae bacterium]|jgi:hypothetical protein|nr:hypothetical protein [Oscillospiraceae bacterium]
MRRRGKKIGNLPHIRFPAAPAAARSAAPHSIFPNFYNYHNKILSKLQEILGRIKKSTKNAFLLKNHGV